MQLPNAAAQLPQRGNVRVDVAMMGARMHYAVPLMLAKSGHLGTFYTDAYLGNQTVLARAVLLAQQLPRHLKPTVLETAPGRRCMQLDDGCIRAFNSRLSWAIALRQLCSTQRCRDHINLAAGRQFGRLVAKARKGSESKIVYAFRTAAAEIFCEARQQGTLCVLEQTIAPKAVESRLLSRELECWPGWQDDFDLGLVSAFMDREKEEWELADVIVCGSEFVRSSLLECGVPGSKCKVVPYGVETSTFSVRRSSPYQGDRPLRLVFVGELGLRKGIHILHAALKGLPERLVECRMIGPASIARDRVNDLGLVGEVIGQVPKAEVIKHLAWADALVLPTICEGSATVTYEALCAGIPVITTPSCGSIVRHEIDGLIVPPGCVDDLARQIERLIAERDLYPRMWHNLNSEGPYRASLDRYQEDLEGLIGALAERK